MWGVAVSMLLVTYSSCGAAPSSPDINLAQPRQQPQEWGVWAEPAVESLDVEDAAQPAPVTRLRRRRRKRIRPYNQDVVGSMDYDDHQIPLRPTRLRYDGEDNQEPVLFAEDRPYRTRSRRRRLKPQQRPTPFREEALLDEGQDVAWREDNTYHIGRPRTRRPILDDEYVPVPRVRSRKRRPLQEPYLDYPGADVAQPQLPPRESQHSREVMIYGDDSVFIPSSTTTRNNLPTITQHEEIQHYRESTSMMSTERVNTFRPSKPRRLTSTLPPATSSSTTVDTHDCNELHNAQLTAAVEEMLQQHISTTAAIPAKQDSLHNDQLPLSPTHYTGRQTPIPSKTPTVLGIYSTHQDRAISNKNTIKQGFEMTNTCFSELENMVPEPRAQSTLPSSDNMKANMSMHTAVSLKPLDSPITNPLQTTQQPLAPLDRPESSDIDPVRGSQEQGQTQNTSPPTELPPPVRIQLDPRIKSIEDLIQKTRQSLEPALSSRLSNATHETDEPMKKIIPLSTLSPHLTPGMTESELSTEPHLQRAHDEIMDLLRSEDSSSRLARILQSRNMTLEELLAHRERGSSQHHLADIFSSTTSTPTTPTIIMQHNYSLQQTLPPKYQHPTRQPLVARLLEQTGKRSSRMFTTSKPVQDPGMHPGRDKYSPVWKTLHSQSFGIYFKASDHRGDEEETASTSYKRVDLDDDEESNLNRETTGKVDRVHTNNLAVNFAEAEEEQRYDNTVAEDIVLGGFSIPVKSGIIASCVILLVTVLVFVGILVGCRWCQRRARLRYMEGIVGARERSTSLDELRGKGVGRSLTPVLVGARDLYSRPPESRRYYLWNTIRKTLQYK